MATVSDVRAATDDPACDGDPRTPALRSRPLPIPGARAAFARDRVDRASDPSETPAPGPTIRLSDSADSFEPPRRSRPETRLKAAGKLVSAGERTHRAKDFTTALGLLGDVPIATHGRNEAAARAHLGLGDTELSESHFDQALALTEETEVFSRAWCGKGDLAVRDRRGRDALASYERAVAFAPPGRYRERARRRHDATALRLPRQSIASLVQPYLPEASVVESPGADAGEPR